MSDFRAIGDTAIVDFDRVRAVCFFDHAPDGLFVMYQDGNEDFVKCDPQEAIARLIRVFGTAHQQQLGVGSKTEKEIIT